MRKKRILALVLVIALILPLFVVDRAEDVYAQDSFYGIETIVQNNSSTEPYRILEIVPDMDAAKIGYLIAGEEPVQWMEKLAQISGKDAREAYMSELKENELKLLITGGVFEASDYDEVYVERSEYTRVELSVKERLDKDMVGYTMKETSQGTGTYTLTEDFSLKEDGDYSQNADYFVEGGSEPYYNVSFEAGPAEGEASYYAVSATTITRANIENFSENEYYYSYDSATKKYHAVGLLADADKDTVIAGGYYVVKFAYSEGTTNSSRIYYKAVPTFSYDFENEKATGRFTAVLDGDQPYVKDESGHFVTSGKYYHLSGAGKGNYSLVRSDDGKLNYPAEIQTIYVNSGVKNKNLFAQGVFNQSKTVTKDLYFDVQTIVAKDVTTEQVAWADFIYLSNSNGVKAFSGSYSAQNDLTEGAATAILQRALSSNDMIPVMLDAGLCDNEKASLAIGKLSRILTSDSENFENLSGWNTDPDTLKYTVDQDMDHHYVNANMYVIPDDVTGKCPYLFETFLVPFISKSDETNFFNEAEDQGFGEIASYINSENTFRVTQQSASGENQSLFEREISKAIAVEYIIGYASKRTTSINPKLRVLDIEPCYPKNIEDKKGAGGKVTKKGQKTIVTEMIETALKDYTDTMPEITVDVMSTAQYIGDINDLSQYDIIYFGDCTDRFYKSGDGKTAYNDTTMNGLIYSNIGDKVSTSGYSLAGLLDTDYTNANKTAINTNSDTTARTFRYSGNDITEMKKTELLEFVQAGYPIIVSDTFLTSNTGNRKVNTDRVDCNSNIYALFDSLFVSQKKGNVISMDQLTSNPGKFVQYLQMGHPMLDMLSNTTSVVELQDNQLSLKFTITNWGAANLAATFDVKLYLDANADGKFSRTEEGISAGDLTVMNGNTTYEPDDSGSYSLVANTGTQYDVYYQLPEEYTGFIPWKLVISQNGNEYRYASQTGYFHRKATGNVKTINVLQIMAGSGSTFNLTGSDTFKRLIQDPAVTADFNIRVTAMTQDKLLREKDYDTEEEWYSYFSTDYDMLILGFADCYQITDARNMVKGIGRYIREGKNILFTHDCTSFWNITQSVKDQTDGSDWARVYWGYDFNQYIRDLVGMDRYGVTSTEKQAEDDIAYVPKSNGSKAENFVQGYTVGVLNDYASGSQKYCYDGAARDSRGDSTQVTRVNEGQITNYPFKIDESFVVSKTHAQYYQLNLNRDSDKDGESDLVVWYTLASGTSSNPLYCSPKDVRNNYYIYTMGNITYSGVGHSIVDYQDSNNNYVNEEEIKLYINTIVAAYSVGLQAPTTTYKEGAKTSSKDKTAIYLSTDDQLAAQEGSGHEYIEEELGLKTETVWFQLQDTNLVKKLKEKNISVGFYVPTTKEEYDEKHEEGSDEYVLYDDSVGTTLYLKKASGIVIRDKKGNVVTDWTKLKNGMYSAEIPYDIILNTDDIYLRSRTTISYTTDKADTTTAYSTDVLKVQKNRLFSLD